MANDTDEKCPSESDHVIDQMDMLDSLLLPCIAIFGIAGNVFSIAIFRQTRKLRRLATSVYLIALAVSDTIFLLSLLLSVPALSLLENRIMCKTIFYFINVAGVFSSWLVVLFTVERFLVIAYPLTRMARCSRSRAKYMVLFMLPLPCIMYIYTAIVLIDVDPVTFICQPKYEYIFVVTILHGVEISITYFIPAFTIVSLNICIGVKLVRSNIQRRELRSGSATGSYSEAAVCLAQDSNGTRNETPTRRILPFKRKLTPSVRRTRSIRSISSDRRSIRNNNSSHTSSNEHAITRTLIVISTTFTFLNLPHNFILLLKLCAQLTSVGECFARSDFMYVLTSICYALYYANFGVNIVVYHVTSSNYRQGAKEMMRRLINGFSTCWMGRSGMENGEGRRMIPINDQRKWSGRCERSSSVTPEGGKRRLTDSLLKSMTGEQ